MDMGRLPGVFVFGSNLAGRHGKGAALHARENYGAMTGVGEGRSGMSYAIPTKDEALRALPIADVRAAILRFSEYARRHPESTFFLTPIGTGLAGINKREIWAAVKAAEMPPNVALTSSWLD